MMLYGAANLVHYCSIYRFASECHGFNRYKYSFLAEVAANGSYFRVKFDDVKFLQLTESGF
jgi:hypothetical protein